MGARIGKFTHLSFSDADECVEQVHLLVILQRVKKLHAALNHSLDSSLELGSALVEKQEVLLESFEVFGLVTHVDDANQDFRSRSGISSLS